MYQYTPFVVISSANREPQPIYGGLYTIGGLRGILFSYMGGRIINGLVRHYFLRRFIIARYDMYFACFDLFLTMGGCVHLSHTKAEVYCLS
jgi:hypothetical protein